MKKQVMSPRLLRQLIGACSLAATAAVWSAVAVSAADAPVFRTDAAPDPKLPWYQLEDGKFPPPGSAHAIAGELIRYDHAERRFRIRVDRDDSQQVSHFDLPLEAVPAGPGSSGVRISVKCCMLLKGFRPGHVVRFFPATWRVNTLPKEEQLYGHE